MKKAYKTLFLDLSFSLLLSRLTSWELEINCLASYGCPIPFSKKQKKTRMAEGFRVANSVTYKKNIVKTLCFLDLRMSTKLDRDWECAE